MNHAPGTVLFEQDRHFANVCLLVRGLVGFMRAEAAGGEMILEMRTAGNLLGAASAISHNPAPVTATTLTDCEVYCLSVKAYLALMKQEPAFLYLIAEALGQQFFEQTARLMRIGLRGARANFSQYLLNLIPPAQLNQPGEIRLALPYEKKVIAKLLAITPEHLSRIQRKLEDDGILRSHKGWIYIRDVKRLAQEAG